ncbi:MAG: hypothetical protein JKP98_25190 [Rhodobacteraceae bacterium]|nr:hypothetical protein [Paracoccaceae bacterium]
MAGPASPPGNRARPGADTRRPARRWRPDARPIAEIERVDRGALAFKPSGGFVLHLAAPGTAGWAPGLWWRVGRRLGVGGATNPMEGRAMADIIAVRIALRDTPRS